MKIIFALAAALCLLSLAAALAPLHGMDSRTMIPDRYIVVLHTDITVDRRDNHVDELTLRLTGKEHIISRFDIGNFIGYSAVLSKDNLMAQLAHPDVQYIEADQKVTIFDTVSQQSGATWGITRCSQRNLSLSLPYSYWASGGANVWAYIIDTGIKTTHNDFGGRAIWGTNTVGDGLSDDRNGHGTHVASTTGGTTYGIAKKVRLVAVKVLGSDGSGTNQGVIDGVNWAAKNHTGRGAGALSVANLSLGGGISTALDNAVNAAVNAGVNVAVAAGNDNTNACNYSPARATLAVTTGATANNDARSSFSNYGNCTDIFAPGTSITAAGISSNTATATMSGTSMASPHVCGVLAVRLGHLSSLGQKIPTTKEMHTWITSTATPNKVTNPGTNSPNRLLYSPYAD